MYNSVPLCADSCRKKCSTANRGPLSEEKYDLLEAAVQGNPDQIPEVDHFVKQNTSYIYSGSCKSKPNFCYDEESGTSYRLTGEGRKEVVHANRAWEIIKNIHRPPGRACRKDGINAIVKCISQQYDCKGVRKMVQDVKANCDGTCKKMATLKTQNPPPKLICTFKDMERVQIDLLEMYSSQSPFVQQSAHSFRLILSVMDCFSKYC